MFTKRKNGDSPNGRLMFQPGSENVSGRVHVSIVRRSAVTALPVPYSKRTHTFRAASGNRPAARARLGSKPFIDFNKHSVVPSGFIRKLCSEHRPTRIQNGLRHLGFCKCSRVHIANGDQAIFTNDPRGLFMQMMFPSVRNLGVNSLDATLVLGSLGLPQRDFVFPVMAERRNRVAIAARRQRLEAKVYADGASAGLSILGNLTLKTNVPATPRILNKAATKVLAADIAGFPEPILLLEVNGGVSVDLYGARYERKPPKRTSRTEAGAKMGAVSMLVAGLGKLSAYSAHGIGVQAELAGASGGEPYKIEGGRPRSARSALAPTLSFSLCGDTKIPHLIARNRVFAEATVSALDPELVAQNRHAPNLVGMPKVFKRGLSIRDHFSRIASREGNQ